MTRLPPLERQLYDLLTGRQLTLATAESCTGGLIGHLVTTVPGSSAYYLGGVIAYSNELKRAFLGVPASILETRGAVSRECAEAMARGIRERTAADIGISTTGIAGPTGATPTKPVGLVYIACASARGVTCEEHRFQGDRLTTLRIAAEAALRLALREAAAL
jgi:PncC family amidohydrolase